MALPPPAVALRAWDFAPRSWDATTWRSSAKAALREGAFLGPFAFVRRVASNHHGLVINVAKYLAVLAAIFACNALGSRLTYAPGAAGTTLLAVFGLAIIQGTLVAGMFPLSNALVKDQLDKAGTHDILTSAYHFHPLWIVSRGGMTVRTQVIENGLGAFAAVLNRFSWYGPMIMGLIAAVLALGTLSMPVATALVAVMASVEIGVLGPRKAQADSARRAASVARSRYATCEKAEFNRLATVRTRGPREYGALVGRIVAFRQFYCRGTYAADWKGAIATTLAVLCTELLSLAVLWWALVATAPDSFVPVEASTVVAGTATASSPAGSGWAAWLMAAITARAARAPVASVSAFIVAVRAVTHSLEQVLTHRKYSAEEIRRYDQVGCLLAGSTPHL